MKTTTRVARWAAVWCVVVGLVLTGAACGDSEYSGGTVGDANGDTVGTNNSSTGANNGTNNSTTSTNNGSTGTNNATTSTNNGSTGSNNASTGTNNSTTSTNNSTTSTNNSTTSTNNSTTSTNNSTTSTNNGTTSTNNGTTSTNNGTTGTNNGTTGTNNNTTPDCAPTGPEVCDGEDNDCNGLIDDRASDRRVWYLDSDGDGAGDENVREEACERPEGYVPDRRDCDDERADINPTATEVCDGEDNNCNGQIDDVAPFTLEAQCLPVARARAVACEDAACVYDCDADWRDIDMDLEDGADGNGCECARGDGLCDPDAEPPEPINYTAPASKITELRIETDQEVGADLDGDGMPDNAFGALVAQLLPLLGNVDVNEALADAIASGQINLGVSWPNFTAGLPDVISADMHIVGLIDADGDPATQGVWIIDPGNFEPGSDVPRYRFDNGDLEGGYYSVRGGRVGFDLPFGGLPLSLQLIRAGFASDVSEDDLGVAFQDGGLSGAVPLGDMFAGINGYLMSDTCACLGLDAPMITPSGGDNFTCSEQPDTAACEGVPDGETCSTLASACSLIVPIFSGSADLDTNGNGVSDAFGAFFWVTAQGADLIEAP